MIPPQPPSRYVKPFFSLHQVAERAARRCPSLLLAQALFSQALPFQFYVRVNFRAEVAGLPFAPEHTYSSTSCPKIRPSAVANCFPFVVSFSRSSVPCESSSLFLASWVDI